MDSSSLLVGQAEDERASVPASPVGEIDRRNARNSLIGVAASVLGDSARSSSTRSAARSKHAAYSANEREVPAPSVPAA
jgi:hypothetical protein